MYLDSASSCHTVTSLHLLDNNTARPINRTVRAVDGTAITLTHKGRRTVHTPQGTITLSEVYYGDGLKYNLISVPAIANFGVKVVFDDAAYIEKGRTKIHLIKADGLWAVPEKEIKPHIASLRMDRSGKANAKIWHERLGHPSDNKLKLMIESKVIPSDAEGFTATTCRTCQLTQPSRRPVPSSAERSGKVTVQVDYMPMGQAEKGWKGL